MENFWNIIPRPIFALAPMEDVTDTVFRELIGGTAAPGKLHVMFTEFTNVDGFLHEQGRGVVRQRLEVSAAEREMLNSKGIRLVAQIWGSDPEKFYRTARTIAAAYNFDGIDINMGCPVKKIVKNNACSALIRTPELAREIILATKEGSRMPVSVKTRTGFSEVVTESWIGNLLDAEPAAITLHGRTQKKQSEGLADWSQVRIAAETRDKKRPGIPVLGNGDVMSFREGMDKAESYQADGIMVGRGIFKNPFFFAANEEPGLFAGIELLTRHLERFSEVWGAGKNFAILKRFFKIYIHSFEGATALRDKMMRTDSTTEALAVLEQFHAAVR